MRKFILSAVLGLLAAFAGQALATGSEYYNHTTYPANGAQLSSASMRAELDLIEAGFGKLPDLVGNGGKLVAVNSGGTALEAVGVVLTNGTAVASTSGTAIDFTGIPSSVKRITVSFVGVSTNGTNSIQLQIGDSGGIEGSGYTSITPFAAGFGVIFAPAAAGTLDGSIQLVLVDAATNTWAASGVMVVTAGSTVTTAGSKSLSATLDRVRITTLAGTDTFDAGKINIQYQ